jgi:hypothetical protein
MNTVFTEVIVHQEANNKDTMTLQRSHKARYFFVAMAILFIIITAVGFGFDYVRVSQSPLKVHWFTRIHGVIMGLWLLVFFTQAMLAAKGKLQYHRQLGLFSAGLGAVVLLTMIAATIRPIIANSPLLNDSEWDVLFIQLYGIISFGLFFTWGMLVRKKAAAHKRLLLLSTMVLMQAGIDRIPFLPGLDAAIFVRFLYLDILIILLLMYDLITLKRIHKITITGGLIIIFIQFMITTSFGSLAWNQFWVDRFAPFREPVVEVKLTDAQIDPVLGAYGNKDWQMTVSRDNGKIYLTLPDIPRFEMAPKSGNEWFLRTMSWKVTFVRGTDGSVVKIVNKQPYVTWEQQRIK